MCSFTFFFFNDTATTEIYTLSLHDALPISVYSKNGYFVHFDPGAFAQGEKSSVYVNAPAGLTFPGDAGYPGNSAGFNRYSNFAPRVGLAWDPKGNGQMSVRAAYGIFYDLPALNYYIGFAQSPPFGNNVTIQ